MMWRDTIDLIAITESGDGAGGLTETETKRQVFANKKSVRQSEFYQAMAYGLKPEIMFEIRSIEYADEPKLEFNGKTYFIVRTFSKNDEMLELVCSTKAVVN